MDNHRNNRFCTQVKRSSLSFGYVFWCSQGNFTALLLASENGHANVVQLLLSSGSDVNALAEVSSLTEQQQNGSAMFLSFSVLKQRFVLDSYPHCVHRWVIWVDDPIWVDVEILVQVVCKCSVLKCGRDIDLQIETSWFQKKVHYL